MAVEKKIFASTKTLMLSSPRKKTPADVRSPQRHNPVMAGRGHYIHSPPWQPPHDNQIKMRGLSHLLACFFLGGALVTGPICVQAATMVEPDRNTSSSFPVDKFNARFLENKVYDIVLITDNDGMEESLGMWEDSIVKFELGQLGRYVKRVSLQNEEFDWRMTKYAVLRSAWHKVSFFCNPCFEN
jgi:hypothetical protein